ncbi:uncharacterized protein [Ptychodera flava]|uniref:uncharacterized protein n=1 Tax=Ptychodera flava TaxID=63121 RepID=UPI003969F99B
MTRARGWWFEKSDDSIFIIFDYRENPSRLRKKGGSSAVYSSVAKFKAYSGIGDDAIKVYFTDKNDHPYKLLRSSFVWNKNDMCRQFRDLRSPQEFCDHFNSVLSGKEDTSSPASSVSNLTNDSSEDDSEPEGESETRENISHSSSNGIESTPDDDDDDDVMSPAASMSNTPLSRSTKKRKLTDAAKQLVLPTLSKKKKAEKLNKEMSEEELSMKESIRDCHIGTGPFLIDISALELGKQARAPDDKWVDKLEAAMEDYLDEAYQPLIVVLKNESKENFRESNVNGYTYEVIGGQHSFLAVKRLSEKYGNRKELKSRLAVVYAGLSDDRGSGWPIDIMQLLNSIIR